MTDYQKYQLQWMIDHGYSLQDLMRGLTEFQYDDPEDSDRISTPISELFNEWEFDRGFGSEIWACEGEWREVECPQRKAVNIQWDIDPEDDDGVELPNEITIPNDIEDEEAISDYISDVTGFCHKGFELEEQLRELGQTKQLAVRCANLTAPMNGFLISGLSAATTMVKVP